MGPALALSSIGRAGNWGGRSHVWFKGDFILIILGNYDLPLFRFNTLGRKYHGITKRADPFVHTQYLILIPDLLFVLLVIFDAKTNDFVFIWTRTIYNFHSSWAGWIKSIASIRILSCFSSSLDALHSMWLSVSVGYLSCQVIPVLPHVNRPKVSVTHALKM